MFCRHKYQYTQGYFYCIKCNHRSYREHTPRNSNKKWIKIGIIGTVLIGIISFVSISDFDYFQEITQKNAKVSTFSNSEDFDIEKTNCIMTSNGLGDIIVNCPGGENYNCKSNSPVRNSVQRNGITQDVTLRLRDKTCQINYEDISGKIVTRSFILITDIANQSHKKKEIENLPNIDIKIVTKTVNEVKETIERNTPKDISKYEANSEPSLDQLKQIALEDINKYRVQNGLPTLSLGSALSPQLYSQELLSEGCIHHISDRGEGPMLRYKNNGDRIFLVAENIGGGLGTSWTSTDQSILDSNSSMMFDDAASNWGHRDNILNSNARSVSIGISYDSQRLVMIQDFEWSLPPGYMYDPSSFSTEPVDARLCW